MGPDTWTALVTNVGFPIALVIYLLLKDKAKALLDQTERASLVEYVRELEKDFREESKKNAEKYEAQSAKSTEAINNNTRWVTHLCSALEVRPCLLPAEGTNSRRRHPSDPELTPPAQHLHPDIARQQERRA